MKVQGFNHITINVSNLSQSLAFYVDLLGMDLIHKGNYDAYLEWGKAWVCLQERPSYSKLEQQHIGIDHVAFTVDEIGFHQATTYLIEQQVSITRGPIKRGGGWTINFLDPDGTVLELHSATLQDRMQVWE
ncbi:glutathione transferase [Pontibacillus yanchengensis]|uniref:Glutathione transferase n=2 Tax=Pontibacillus yanchengensis TaxID=462910 RepID=A0ACC7VDX9_9BACI|nr:VOC family protein [Pontibacillus yanchengensis]MYL32411.1 glutathione transferase [Pontibacillus yanchengensis]MYL52992.1 glutathione transferase [Pontibacillus yanchengensis]